MKQSPIPTGPVLKDVSVARLTLIGTPIVFVAYTTALAVGHGSSIRDALPGGFANTIPTVLFGAIAFQVIRAWLMKQHPLLQATGHAALCAIFSVVSYWLLVVLLGAVAGVSVIQFNVAPFPVRASVWQLLENATVYAVIATFAYRGTASPQVTVVLSADRDEGHRGLSRYFIRSGDDIQPIDIDSIVSIAGADDYAEVATLNGRHLVRMTLAEFERSLDPERFLRVHRSRIVNFERIVRAEPAGGGRMLLHMEDGEAIPASRAGSRLLRHRVI